MKRMTVFFLLCALMLGLCGCGDKGTEELDGAALVKALLDGGAFSQKLEELPASKATAFYGVDSARLTEALLYHASGVSKEQIAVFHMESAEAAGDVVTLLQQTLEGWIAADRDYAPEEVPKLEKAVLRQSGAWVVLVVANDPTAAARTVGEYI